MVVIYAAGWLYYSLSVPSSSFRHPFIYNGENVLAKKFSRAYGHIID